MKLRKLENFGRLEKQEMIITKVLSEKGQEISKRETFEKLVALNSSDIYNKQKASGYIGGSNDFI